MIPGNAPGNVTTNININKTGGQTRVSDLICKFEFTKPKPENVTGNETTSTRKQEKEGIRKKLTEKVTKPLFARKQKRLNHGQKVNSTGKITRKHGRGEQLQEI